VERQNLVAESQSLQKGCALNATEHSTHRQSPHQSRTEPDGLSTDMGLLWNSTKRWLKNVATYVTSVSAPQMTPTLAHTGMGNFASTTAMTQARSEVCSATTAILLSDTERRQAYLNELHRISDFTVDQIVAIAPDGQEEVFDVEVDRTENFIANGVVSHNTRWSKRDLTGKVLQSMIDRDGEKWEVVEFPAILPSGNPLWPEFWSIEELTALRDELPVSKWNAQYQQEPTGEDGALVKREWWKVWEKDDPPPCDYILQSWDTAFTKGERSDYSACTTWGIFYLDENPNDANIILLDAVKKRMEFPELKAAALRYYQEWQPDTCIIEAKAAGAPLVFELRKMGVPVSEYTPTRGNDKIARVNAITDLFSSGKVWAPKTRWAEEVVEELAAFPNSEHDDLVDSTSQALIRFRKGGFIKLHSDEEDEIIYPRKAAYY